VCIFFGPGPDRYSVWENEKIDPRSGPVLDQRTGGPDRWTDLQTRHGRAKRHGETVLNCCQRPACVFLGWGMRHGRAVRHGETVLHALSKKTREGLNLFTLCFSLLPFHNFHSYFLLLLFDLASPLSSLYLASLNHCFCLRSH